MQYTSMYLHKPNYQPENNDIGAEIYTEFRVNNVQDGQPSRGGHVKVKTTEDDNQNDPCVAALV